MESIEKINDQELNNVSGGNDGRNANGLWRTATPCVRTGYLALRSRPAYDESNEISAIYNGEMFKVNMNKWNGNYIWASYANSNGWVNSDYITVL